MRPQNVEIPCAGVRSARASSSPCGGWLTRVVQRISPGSLIGIDERPWNYVWNPL